MTHGYGIAEQVRVIQAAGRQFRQGDPQARYVAGLDRSAAEEYEAALFGGAAGATPGCLPSAVDATGGPAALGDDRDLVHAYGEALHRYRTDGRVRDIEAGVLGCMADRGRAFERYDDIEAHFQIELHRLVGGTADFDEQGRLRFSWGPSGDRPLRIPRAGLDRIREEELSVARTEVVCRDRHAAELAGILAGHSAPVIAEYRPSIREAALVYERIEEGRVRG